MVDGAHLVVAAFDSQGRTVDQRLGDGFTRFGKNSAERVAGYAHPNGCGFHVQALEVGETNRLQPLDGKTDLGEVPHWDALRLKIGCLRDARDLAAAPGSGQGRLLLLK